MDNNIEKVGIWATILVALIGGILMVMGGIDAGAALIIGDAFFAMFYIIMAVVNR